MKKVHVLDLLIFLTIAFPCWYVYRRCVTHRMVQIDHVGTFTFGYLFYWITPLAVRAYLSHVKFPLASTWVGLFREKLIMPYALTCLALYLCFALGDSLGTKIFHDAAPAKERLVPRLALSLTALAGCILLVYTIMLFRAELQRPSLPSDLEAQAARGAVTTCVIVFAVLSIIFTVDSPEMSWSRRLRSSYFLLLLAGSVLLLWLGSRLYVASFLVMFAVYQSCFRKRFKLRTVVLAGVMLALLFGAIGMWREGGGVSGAAFNILEEPMLNSLSLVHHLRYKGIAWTNAPLQLESDLLNLVPSVLLPNKIEILKKPDAYRPLGGLNSFVSFNLNFGVLGTGVFLFVWPILFRYARSRARNIFFATAYILCSGWLAFTFFRDPFSISLVKAILQDSIAMPLVIIGFGALLTASCSPRIASQELAGDLQAGTP